MIRRIPLNGEWKFAEAGRDNWETGTVPGCVQLDLMALGKLPDPFYRMDEHYAHELEDKEWIYRKEFDLGFDPRFEVLLSEAPNPEGGHGDYSMGDYHMAELVFMGLDTLADIYLNGEYLGRAENMFIPHRYDVTSKLAAGRNMIEIRFASPIREIKAMERNSPVKLMATCETARPYVRKAQYSYGWDWGPRLAQVGIWRPVYLELIKDASIEHPFFFTREIRDGKAYVSIQAEVRRYVEGELSARVDVAYEGETVASCVVSVKPMKSGEEGIEAFLVIDSPRLWCPNGLELACPNGLGGLGGPGEQSGGQPGEQPLYEIKITLSKREENGEEVIDERSFRSGIRTVRLLQERDGQGTSFIFEINGTRVFAKGADWIPADNLLPRLTREDYEEYIRLAREANMNMLRIWGGGIYEDGAFYEACDRHGIMVWQDFMYACAEYPDQFEWFRKLAREEAVEIVKALRNHPSIVLWCGNNENNWGFHSWWKVGDPEFLGNYIYKQMLPRICAEYDPSRPYWVSSPYGGEDPDPNSEREGDRHAWDVWSRWVDYDQYRQDRGRFLSEFGFQAMPDWRTVLSYTAPEDRHVLSPVMLAHNKMPEGMERLIRFLVGRIGFPRDLRSFVYLTQFNQVEAVKMGVEHWRSRKFATAGTLYWQFNDCWPVASWSCLDYYRRKKALYYYTRRFFANLLVVIKQADDGIILEGVNDTTREVPGRLRVAAYDLKGGKLGQKELEVRLPANDATKLARCSYEELGIGYEPRLMPVDLPGTTLPVKKNGRLLDSVVFVELAASGSPSGLSGLPGSSGSASPASSANSDSPGGLGGSSGSDGPYRNYAVFERFRNLNLVRPDIAVEVKDNHILLRSDVPAFGVFIEPEREVELQDNCLNMEPGVTYAIGCSGDPGRVEVFDLTRMVASN
ncbi:MAG: glycoside hydrolase family 2 protein [Firmicutes bacterium]|nr:glycoside hydrolase family 2 protein [Bacillota bacterium]